MVTAAENDTLVRVGRGTPMGELMRQFWLPVLPARRLEADGAPVEIRILGEDCVAFRDTDGKVALIDERCPHRGASMAIGRNEQCGLRCVLHGWKVDADGKVVDAPNMPENARLDRIPTGYRPTTEAAGIIWGWFGGGAAPPLPKYPWTTLPESHVMSVYTHAKCNWLQMLETLWDPFHVSVLHSQAHTETYGKDDEGKKFFASGLPEFEFETTDYGFTYSTTSNGITLGVPQVLPSYSFHTISFGDDEISVIGHVPIDDEQTLFWMITYNKDRPIEPEDNAYLLMNALYDDYSVDYTAENMWHQDRDAMAAGKTFTGIGAGLGPLSGLLEDMASLESMGTIFDRSNEHLAPTDAMVIRGRKVLEDAMAKAAKGEHVPGTGDEVAQAWPSIRAVDGSAG
jgi:phthalate 4,5-dioxygenase